MSAYKDIYVRKVFSAQALTTGGTSTSAAIDLGSTAQNGNFSLQYSKTGSGVVTVTYSLSNDGTTFATPSTAVDIATSIAAGAQSDLTDFTVEPARWMKIIITETGTNSAVFTGWVAID